MALRKRHGSLLETDVFTELYNDGLSHCPSDNESDGTDNYVPQSGSDSSDSEVILTKRCRTAVVDSDNESDISDANVASGYSSVTVSNTLPSTSVQDWNTTDIPPILKKFPAVAGVAASPSELENISEITGLTFGNDYLELLAFHTNLYHQQTEALHKPSPKVLKWANVTLLEVRKFLGLIILMGHVRKLHWKDYWSTDPVLETPIFPKTMSRTNLNRF
jgi:hypothetical protein